MKNCRRIVLMGIDIFHISKNILIYLFNDFFIPYFINRIFA